jgi:hypothetical protein
LHILRERGRSSPFVSSHSTAFMGILGVCHLRYLCVVTFFFVQSHPIFFFFFHTHLHFYDYIAHGHDWNDTRVFEIFGHKLCLRRTFCLNIDTNTRYSPTSKSVLLHIHLLLIPINTDPHFPKDIAHVRDAAEQEQSLFTKTENCRPSPNKRTPYNL